MKTYYLLVVASLLLTVPAMAAAMGQCPFNSLAGTGAITQNANARGNLDGVTGLGWFDLCTSDVAGQSTPYRAMGTEFMTYTETWDQPQTLGTVMIASPTVERSTAGTIYVKTSPDPEAPYVPVCDFNEAQGKLGFYDVNRTGVYGVKIEVNQKSIGAGDYYQIGSIGLYEERFVDVAYGMATIGSVNAAQLGNMTDHDIGNSSRFTSQTIGSDATGQQYVGVSLGQDKLIQGLLIETSAYGDNSAWKNFDVQVFVDVTGEGEYDWVTLGRASQDSLTDLYWVDFGPGGVLTSAVRLYGDVDGGNHPDGKLISAIMAFEVVPEPATMTLLVLGGLSLLRRRR